MWHAAERGQRLVEHARSAHAGIGDDQRLAQPDALAFALQQIHDARVEVDLGEVLDVGHAASILCFK
jgi:hypothetical protein